MLSPSTCRFPRMSRLYSRASAPATPLPPSNEASPAAPSANPRAFAFGVRKPQYLFEMVQTRTKYARHDAHHFPPTSTAALSSTPRAEPSRSCNPSPRHAQGPPTSTSIRFLGHCFLHTPARNTRPAHISVSSRRRLNTHPRNVFTYCRHFAQSCLSPCFRPARQQPSRDTPPCPAAQRIPLPTEHVAPALYLPYLGPPTRPFSDCHVEYHPYWIPFLCVVVSNFFFLYFGLSFELYTVLNE
ncbi:hypothetical protein K438DRAFT_1822024 [Mycena galopus ATCC 62051]|nr:hypothetical protein K438DRAFT_1822024 [Mycena galopus ATCC 62051]